MSLGMVVSSGWYAGTNHVAVPHGPGLLKTVSIHQFVENRENLVKPIHHLCRFEVCKQPR